MTWVLLLTPVLFATASPQTTPKIPVDVLNDLAALQSAEKILENIDEFTSTGNPDTQSPISITAVTEKTTKQTPVVIADSPIEDGRRFGAAPLLDSRYNNNDIKGLEVIYEMKRRMQKHLERMMQTDASTFLPNQLLTHIAQPLPAQNKNTNQQLIYPYYGLPPRADAAEQSGFVLNSQTQTEIPTTLPSLDSRLLAFADYAHPTPKVRAQNHAAIFQQASIVQTVSESPASWPLTRPVPRPQPKTPAPVATKTIPEWVVHELAEIRRARRPMDSPSVAPPLPAQPLYPGVEEAAIEHSSSILQADLEAAFLEARAKMMTNVGLRDPTPPYRTAYTIVPSIAPHPLPPQRPVPTVSSPSLAMLPRAHQPPLMTSNRYKVISTMDNKSQKLQRLMVFMKNNRDSLLQFIALKRKQLLMKGAGKGAVGGNGIMPPAVNEGRAPNYLGGVPAIEALVRGNGPSGNTLRRPGKVAGGGKALAFEKTFTINHAGGGTWPVARALPPDYPAHRLDLSPGVGARIDHLRNKERLCQRNVMQVAGPKYDSQAMVVVREFRPGVDGRAFRVTRRKKLLLPACCNCCKKSVLGCQ